MPSTYTLNNGIELIGTGEQSGTWGDTTNTNLGLLDVALDGQVTVALASAGSSGSPNSLPITDGTASNGRNRMVVFSDSGDLGATAYVQLTPNDAEKIIYIRNSLSGSRSVILFQGTYNASNDYEVPAGTTAIVYFDGAGAGAVAANVFNNAYFDGLRLGSVSVTAILDEDNMASDSATALATQQSIKAYVDSQVGTVDTLAEILAIGNTTGATDIAVDSAQKVQFRDAAIYINSSVDGQLDIVADTEIQIAATTIDVNGALDVSGTALVTGVLTTTAATVSNGGGQFNGAINVGVDDTGYDVKFFGATTGKSLLWDESADSLIVTGTTTLVGTTNLDAVDIDGATQIDSTVTVGVDDTGYDVKFFGATAGAYMLWDESADDLILGGAAGLSVNSTALVTGVLTTTAATVHTGGITMPDNARATFGTGSDFQLYHDGSNNVIGITTGNLYVQSNGGSILLQPTAGEEGITIQPNSSVSLYYDSALKLATTATGIDVTGTAEVDTLSIGGTAITSTAAELNILDGVTSTAAELNILDGVTATAAELNYNDITTLGTVQASKTVTADASGDVLFPDGDKAIFGAGSDLQIYHDGSHSYISDQGTGRLKIFATDLEINNAGNTANYIQAFDGGAVQLFYNNAEKLATSATGVTVTGTVAATAVTGDGSGLTSLTSANLTGTVASGRMPSGSVLQVVTHTTNTNFSTASSTPANTQLVLAITPTSATSKVLVLVHHADVGKAENAINGSVRLTRDGTAVFTASGTIGRTDDATTSFSGGFDFHFLDSPATTSAVTYRTQAWTADNTTRFYLGLLSAYHSITLLEIAG
jgi:hypothetical protein